MGLGGGAQRRAGGGDGRRHHDGGVAGADARAAAAGQAGAVGDAGDAAAVEVVVHAVHGGPGVLPGAGHGRVDGGDAIQRALERRGAQDTLGHGASLFRVQSADPRITPGRELR